MKIREFLVTCGAVLAVGALAAGTASADSINTRPVTLGAGDPPSLQSVFNSQMVNPYNTATDQNTTALWLPAPGQSSSTTLIIEIAGFKDGNELGIYSKTGGSSQNQTLFGGSAGTGSSTTIEFTNTGHIKINNVDMGVFDLTGGFGFFLKTPATGNPTYYTEDSRNSGDAQALVYNGGSGRSITIGSNVYTLGSTDWIIAFEDMSRGNRFGLGSADNDYNDFVFLASGIIAVPEPASIALLAAGGLALRFVRRRRATA